ncbi:MAG: glycosyltransferase family 4 protein [Acidobacteriota bacterium]
MSAERGRILLLGTFLSRRRSTRAVGEDLADRLQQRGWRVATASSFVHPLPRLLDSLAVILRRRSDYDVAHIDLYSGRAFQVAEACAGLLRRLDRPYLITLHGGGLADMASSEPNRVRALLSGALAVTSPSDFLREALAPLRPDIEVLPNPVPLENYTYRERASLRPKLLWLRAFADIYRPADAVRTVRTLRERGRDAEVHIIGPDKGGQALDEVKRERRGLERWVHLEADGIAKPEVAATFDTADIFLNTSSVDNTPVTVIEAMASGLPVVSTDAGGLKYLIRSGSDGLLVPVGDPHAMADAVERLLDEPGLGLALTRTARAKVERWDWRHVIVRWEELFLEALGSRSAA